MKTAYIGTKSAEPVVYRCEWDRDDTVLPGSRFGPVVRGVYLVECNVRGYGSVVIDDCEYPVTPGDTYLLFPGSRIIHTAAAQDPRRAIWCSFGGMSVARILSSAGISPTSPFLPREKTEKTRTILEKIYSRSGDSTLSADLFRTSALYELLSLIAEGRAPSDRNLFVDRAIGIMESGYNTDLTVADIAAEIGFDRTYFSTMFRHYTGTTPHAYLTALRVSRATALLEDGSLPVSAVAEAVGLDPRNFSRLLRREIGKSPKQLKSKIIE